MKSSLIIALSTLLLSIPALAQKVELPNELRCQRTLCVFNTGEDSECSLDYFAIKNINSGTILSSAGRSGTATTSQDENFVTINFSKKNIHTLTFHKDAMEWLNNGNVRSINGYEQNGFIYNGNEHIETMRIVECESR